MPIAIIADDERLMRDQLRLRLSEAWPELEIPVSYTHLTLPTILLV